LFQKAMESYAKWQADGRIESFEPVILSAHGGDLNGFVMLRRSAEKLSELREDDKFMELVVEANFCLEGLGVVVGYIGEGLTKIFSQWGKLFSG
jgi:hypothetical protein